MLKKLSIVIAVILSLAVFTANPSVADAQKRILVTGFEPFGKEKINPSWEAVKGLPDEIKGWEVVKLRVPVTWDHTKGVSSIKMVTDAIDEFQPDAILLTGLSGANPQLVVEKQGRNAQGKYKDNNNVTGSGGKDPVLSKTYPEALAVYKTTTPNEKMIKAIKEAGVPAISSSDPGKYICEHVIYRTGHYLSLRGHDDKKIPFGFIHVPYLPTQAKNQRGAHHMPLEEIVKGYAAAIKAIIADN